MNAPGPRRSSGGRIAIILISTVVIGGAAFGVYMRSTDYPTTILVDGKPIVTLDTERAAKRVLNTLRTRDLNGAPAGSVRFVQKVAMRKAPSSSQMIDEPEAYGSLEDKLSIEAEMYVIMVDDKPVVGLPTRSDAERALSMLKEKYAPKSSKQSVDASFKQSVKVSRRHDDVRIYRRSADDALEVMTSPSQDAVYHSIENGDRAVRIALRYGISVTELESLNPGIDLDKLHLGDRLLVSTQYPPVTVVTKSLVDTVTTVDPPSARRGYRGRGQGKRHTRAYIIYENGIKVDEQPISQITTWNRSSRSRGSYYGDDEEYRPRSRYRRHRRRHASTADQTQSPGSSGGSPAAQAAPNTAPTPPTP